jgi:hypothetical protein
MAYSKEKLKVMTLNHLPIFDHFGLEPHQTNIDQCTLSGSHHANHDSVTCRRICRKQVDKHVSAEIRFLETNHRWVLNKRFLGYENEICRFLETNTSLWNQQALPCKRVIKTHFLGYRYAV